MRDTKQLSAALLCLRRFDAHRGGKSRLRARRIACVFLALMAVVCGIWALFGNSAKAVRYGSIVPAVRLAFTNPVAFAKSHVTGGIGAVVLADSATGLPRIQTVLADSPAARAGLRGGDVILEIDGLAARGRTLAQNIDRIRGLAASPVALTIQRAGSTNLNCVIHRSSWSGLGISQ